MPFPFTQSNFMPRAGDILDLSPIGAIFHIKKTAAETQGRSFEMDFEGLHQIVRSGAVSAGRITPKTILYMSVLMTGFEDEIRTVDPPHAVMRVFAVVGRLLGYRIADPGGA